MKFFPRTFFAYLLTCVIASGLILYVGMGLARKQIRLMPQAQSDIVWTGAIQPPPSGDKPTTDTTTRTTVLEEGDVIHFEIFLSSSQSYPYASYDFSFFTEENERRLVDLETLQSFSFRVKCSPKNVLIFVLFTFDDKVSVLTRDNTHRVNWHFFTCDGYWSDKKIKLRDFETPDWWLQQMDLQLADKKFNLKKSMGFAIVNSLQSPRDTLSQISIAGLTGIEERPVYLYLSVFIVLILWVGLGWRAVILYARRLVDKAKMRMKEDMPLTAYQKLSISTRIDETKRKLLLFLATEYADPVLSLDATVERLGINKNKINTILKEELGLTFTAYVNKLRLTEAARLLSEHPEETISQIAYQVGFNNVSYFNKLFKETYGCSPKHFKSGLPSP